MPRFSFRLQGLLLTVTAIALPLRFWPPYFIGPTLGGDSIRFNESFWKVIGIEAVVLIAIVVARMSDAARLKEDHSLPDDE